jgi:short-subunit dehydrogenase
MDLRIAGRRAIVTGSSSGIGYAIAEALACEGAHVILNGRSEKNLDAAVHRVQKAVDGAACEAHRGGRVDRRRLPAHCCCHS